jgi:hypothetical protein
MAGWPIPLTFVPFAGASIDHHGHATFNITQIDSRSVRKTRGATKKIQNKATARYRPPANIDSANEPAQRQNIKGSADTGILR